MRAIILVLFFLSIKAQSQALTTDVRSDENIYLYALKEYCNSKELSTKNINVQFDSTVMWYDWPVVIYDVNINYLEGNSEITSHIKANKGSIVLVKIVPLQYKNEKFFVNVIPFVVSSKKNSLSMVNGGGLSVIFNYNENLKGFTFSETKSYGN